MALLTQKTLQQWKETQFKIQKGKCCLCGLPLDSWNHANADHNHHTGHMRGLSSGMTSGQLQNVGATFTKEELAQQAYDKMKAEALKKWEANEKVIKKNQEDALRAKEEQAAANAKIDQRLREEAQKEAEKAAKEAERLAKAAAAEAKKKADEAAREAKRIADELVKSKKESYDALNRVTIEGFSSDAASMASGNAKLQRGYEDIKLLMDKGIIDATEHDKRRKALISAMGGNFHEQLLGLDPETVRIFHVESLVL